jgi:hypothetical protein
LTWHCGICKNALRKTVVGLASARRRIVIDHIFYRQQARGRRTALNVRICSPLGIELTNWIGTTTTSRI